MSNFLQRKRHGRFLTYVAHTSSFFHSILRWSVAVSTMRRQSSRIAAFLQADARPMFCWPSSASTARSQVWLGLHDGRFQSGGSPRITAATARWWSSCGELRAIRGSYAYRTISQYLTVDGQPSRRYDTKEQRAMFTACGQNQWRTPYTGGSSGKGGHAVSSRDSF